MLVLTRHENERIYINNGEIVITIVNVKPNGGVRIGIDAPRELRVDREEVFLRIQEQRQREGR
jgi:carbon storage regulator